MYVFMESHFSYGLHTPRCQCLTIVFKVDKNLYKTNGRKPLQSTKVYKTAWHFGPKILHAENLG